MPSCGRYTLSAYPDHMTDDSRSHDGFTEVINLLAAPIAGGIRTVEHFRRGAEELIKAIENMNRTMETLNEAATRVNRLIADIEEPVRALVPQLVRTIETAERITDALDSPIRAAAPKIATISETLSSPGFSELPAQLGEFMQTLGDMSQRLGPLTQLAETAGGLFGGLKLPGMGGSKPPAGPAPSEPSKLADSQTPVRPAATSKKASATNTAQPSVNKKAAKKSPTKQAAAKKSPAKKSPTKPTESAETKRPVSGAGSAPKRNP